MIPAETSMGFSENKVN